MTTLEDWIRLEDFTLSLSSGYFGFFAHCGFLKALEEKGLVPSKITGASAGALIAGLWASGLPIEEIEKELFLLKREEFWDPKIGFGLLKGNKFEDKLRSLMLDTTFENCRVPLQVSAYNILKNRTDTLDKGCIVKAVHASCALPGLFQPIKVNNQLYLDGGARDKGGMKGVGELERTLYHYLDSKSLWRIPKTEKSKYSKRFNTKTIIIKGLPRSGPFKLHIGKQALEHAYEKTHIALTSPITNYSI